MKGPRNFMKTKKAVLTICAVLIFILFFVYSGLLYYVLTSTAFNQLMTRKDRSLANEVFVKATQFKSENGKDPRISDIYFDDLAYFDAFDNQITAECDAFGYGCKKILISSWEEGFVVRYAHDLFLCSRAENTPDWNCYWNN